MNERPNETITPAVEDLHAAEREALLEDLRARWQALDEGERLTVDVPSFVSGEDLHSIPHPEPYIGPTSMYEHDEQNDGSRKATFIRAPHDPGF